MSSPGAAHPSSPASASPEILTPSRKVQALLAKFDDSEEDEDVSVAGPKVTSKHDRTGNALSSSNEESEDEMPVARRSRIAARLEDGDATSIDPLSSYQTHPSPNHESSHPAPKRRLLLKRKSSPVSHSSSLREPAAPSSPLFFDSPSASRNASSSSPPQHDSESEDLPANFSDEPKQKFLALVEKHRKQRLEKEAVEAAKKKAQSDRANESDKPRRQRGSSPADDSDEDSDASAMSTAKKLTKEAKPTRKASKKAVEEMKRETQRMSRNMQLAHQARTKKKITKESLLAKFNFTLPGSMAQDVAATSASSVASLNLESDDEAKENTTPPTSPPQEPVDGAEKNTASAVLSTPLDQPSVADGLVLEPPPLKALEIPGPTDLEKGKGKATSMATAPESTLVAAASMPAQMAQRGFAKVVPQQEKKKMLQELLKNRRSATEDQDLDIVTARGDQRKYAAFEKLPKRKTLQKSSYLAPRSLAHLQNSDKSGRSFMSSGELEFSLRRAARMQSREEREQKIAELRAKGVIIQTAEEREKDQQEVEDLVERARQEAAEIQKREKELAKKNGTYVKDGIDSDDSDDEDFEEFEDEADSIDSEDEEDVEDENEDTPKPENEDGELVDDAAEETESDEDDEASRLGSQDASIIEEEAVEEESDHEPLDILESLPRKSRRSRVIADDEDETEEDATSPQLLAPAKTPQSLTRSGRKQIPGLNMSDDLPIGLSQAFAATMADSQTQENSPSPEQESCDIIRELPSPGVAMVPRLNRLESIDVVSNSQPSETQPLNISLSFSQSQPVPESPLMTRGIDQSQFTPSQAPFEPTQDGGYIYSPFQGRRFDTPQQQAPHSTADTVILPNEVDASPVVQRKSRLQRGRTTAQGSDDDQPLETDKSAFAVMKRAAKKADQKEFDKSKSNARNIVDEAAEESDDEYAGLGGASDDEFNEIENDDDRKMIDHDTEVGKGDEARLAGLFADRERKNDEAAVSKLLKDITTGALRRKRGVNDDLDLSDEEDAATSRREAKRREFAKMRRELLKDEAVGKIAEDKKKEAFLRSIEDHEAVSEDDDDAFGEPEMSAAESGSQSQAQLRDATIRTDAASTNERHKRPLEAASDSQLNRPPPSMRRTNPLSNKRPKTLDEIRQSVSFLIEEPNSQAAVVDLGLSDSEDEPEAYVNLDRHLRNAEADENANDSDDDQGLADFIVDDEDGNEKDSQDHLFKKPAVPPRPSFAERRTRSDVVDRLTLLRQSSSTSSNSSTNSKMAFYSSTSALTNFKMPSLLKRATTNSSISSISSTENVSATGVTTARTERGNVSEDKEFIRKGKGGNRNAVNYQGPTTTKTRMTVREEKMSLRAGVTKNAAKKKTVRGGFLGGLFGGGSWS